MAQFLDARSYGLCGVPPGAALGGEDQPGQTLGVVAFDAVGADIGRPNIEKSFGFPGRGRGAEIIQGAAPFWRDPLAVVVDHAQAEGGGTNAATGGAFQKREGAGGVLWDAVAARELLAELRASFEVAVGRVAFEFSEVSPRHALGGCELDGGIDLGAGGGGGQSGRGAEKRETEFHNEKFRP